MNSKRIMWCFWTSCMFIVVSGILLHLMNGQINGQTSSNSIAYLFAGGSLVSATVGVFLFVFGFLGSIVFQFFYNNVLWKSGREIISSFRIYRFWLNLED